MEIGLSIHFEIFRTLMFFASFWLIFYKLHYQESQTRRILLVVCMVLYRPLSSFVVYNPFVKLPGFCEILFSSALIAGLALISWGGGGGGGERGGGARGGGGSGGGFAWGGVLFWAGIPPA
ncbi:MAG: hypothetical protein LBI28_07475, partial [Treponema sp.]|nr:hypothetical protein [Treponema sp.]